MTAKELFLTCLAWGMMYVCAASLAATVAFFAYAQWALFFLSAGVALTSGAIVFTAIAGKGKEAQRRARGF